jgi:hypothetical protein
MPLEIVNFPFNSQDDKCLVLSNAQWAATGLGSAWKRLRVGIRFAVENYPTFIPAPLRLFIGVMSNPVNGANGQLANGYLSENVGHMVGLCSSATSNWSRDASTTRDLVSFNGTLQAVRAQGGALSYATGSTSGFYLLGSLSSFATKRFAIIVEIVKSVVGSSYNAAVNFTAPYWSASNVSNPPPAGTLTLAQFLSAIVAFDFAYALRTADPGFGSSETYYLYSSFGSLSVNESTYGPLNAIHVSWGKISPRIAISDICYAIIE